MSAESTEKYVAFLRGINVGGHHKVPMAALRKELESMNCQNVVTLLNSGNIIFDAKNQNLADLEEKVATQLEKAFGFAIPTLIRNAELITNLLQNDPFKQVEVTKDIRLYISFLKKATDTELTTPWTSPDNSFTILEIRNNAILSVLDLSASKTIKAMGILEKMYGKDITTRNWNTIKRIGKKLGIVN